jgi:hypothetical protein
MIGDPMQLKDFMANDARNPRGSNLIPVPAIKK